MQRKIASFTIANNSTFKIKVLNWLSQFNTFCFLDSNDYNDRYKNYDYIAAADTIESCKADNNILIQLKEFISTKNDWFFGHCNYELGYEIQNIPSKKLAAGFPTVYFFQPKIVLTVKENQLTIYSAKESPEKIVETILQFPETVDQSEKLHIDIQPVVSKEEYKNTIQHIQKHIHQGNCYELNFCQEFKAFNVSINPLAVYNKLTAISPMPFSSLYRINKDYLLCASPERFIQKKGNTIISQPIKGTIKRDIDNIENDRKLKQTLSLSTKDKAENVMVVDLVRNDLSKICQTGSVRVNELFGIYSFPQVHQMISTIQGTIKNDVDFIEVLQATFPMGSMTGAPKKKVMELIAQYEKTPRGIYSGTLGYISPEGDFDFNVVIRSAVYNIQKQVLSYAVGGGITFYSNAEKEYDECLLKAAAIKKVLNLK